VDHAADSLGEPFAPPVAHSEPWAGHVPRDRDVLLICRSGNRSGSAQRQLQQLGYQRVFNVAGGMNAIQFHDDGSLTGAACWRADGTPIGVAGGLARAGVRFGLA